MSSSEILGENSETAPQGSAQGASRHKRSSASRRLRPKGRYHDERVQLPADRDSKLAFLREVIGKGESRGWRMISATGQQNADVLLVTWDTQGALSE
jgi:hypothetical protein